MHGRDSLPDLIQKLRFLVNSGVWCNWFHSITPWSFFKINSVDNNQFNGAGEKISRGDGEARCESLNHVQVRPHLQQGFLNEPMEVLIAQSQPSCCRWFDRPTKEFEDYWSDGALKQWRLQRSNASGLHYFSAKLGKNLCCQYNRFHFICQAVFSKICERFITPTAY